MKNDDVGFAAGFGAGDLIAIQHPGVVKVVVLDRINFLPAGGLGAVEVPIQAAGADSGAAKKSADSQTGILILFAMIKRNCTR